MPLAGGDVAVAYGVELVDGRRVFVKTHRAPPSGFFSTEAAGWRGSVRRERLTCQSVLAVSDEVPSLLVLSWIERGTARGVTEQDLGRRLAALHQAGAPVLRPRGRRTTGSRALPNEPAATWAEFYGHESAAAARQLAADAGALPADDGRSAAGARRPARAASAAPSSHRRGSTATCGPATASSTPTGEAGRSTPPPTAAIASSTSP